MDEINGLLLIDKKVGERSAACVAEVRDKFKIKRVGHAGTLDSTASGLLIILLGQATRLSDYVMSLAKIYRVVIKLGVMTSTCDYSGEVLSERDYLSLDEQVINNALFKFIGWRMQRPPVISAVKVGGRAAHKLARAGVELELKSRPVFIKYIKLLEFNRAAGELALEVCCSKGTYIRSLARDLGEVLNCGGHVKSLRRLAVGNFRVENAGESLINLREVGELFYKVKLNAAAEAKLTHGVGVALADAGECGLGCVSLGRGVCVCGANLFGFADLINGELRPRVNIFDAGGAI